MRGGFSGLIGKNTPEIGALPICVEFFLWFVELSHYVFCSNDAGYVLGYICRHFPTFNQSNIYIYTYIHNICLYPYVSTYESISEDLQATYALRMAVAADTPPQPHPIYAAGGGGMERNQRNRSTKLEMRINFKKNVG